MPGLFRTCYSTVNSTVSKVYSLLPVILPLQISVGRVRSRRGKPLPLTVALPTALWPMRTGITLASINDAGRFSRHAEGVDPREEDAREPRDPCASRDLAFARLLAFSAASMFASLCTRPYPPPILFESKTAIPRGPVCVRAFHNVTCSATLDAGR